MAINLYRSKIKFKIQSDLIFIFSDEEQKDKFDLRVKNELGIEDMIYNIMPKELLIYKAQAVTKKLYGLKEFMGQYDYIILVDCESVFVKNFDAAQLAEEIWNSHNMFAANFSLKGFFIMRKCYKAMGLYYNKKLRKALSGFKYNFWFNELQVYKCSYLINFFDWLNNYDIEKIYNTWDCFEYYVFYAYLCLEHDMQIKKYHYYCIGCGVNEFLYAYSIKKQEKIFNKMQFHWTTSDKIKSEKICMLFHLDRVQNYYANFDARWGRYIKRADASDRIICIQFIMFLKRIKHVTAYIINFIKRCFILIKEFPEYMRETMGQ